MALAINIEDLLNKQKIESNRWSSESRDRACSGYAESRQRKTNVNRVEFKAGWNPASIYHSVCAFANDFDDLGGGYIVVGVETDEDRTFFHITIPCHEAAGNIIADIANKDDIREGSQKGSQKDGSSCTSQSTEDDRMPKSSAQQVIDMIRDNPDVTTSEMAERIGISRRSIAKITNKLQADGIILRVGARKDGHWEVR